MPRKKKNPTVMIRVNKPTHDFIKDFARKTGKSIPDAMRILTRRMNK